MKPTFIYALCDPDGSVRYIGKTIRPAKRLTQHIVDCKTGTFHRHTWLRSLLARGERPLFKIIEEVSAATWEEREQYWIKRHREAGCRLTNATDGGDGFPDTINLGRKHTPQAIANMVAGRVGRVYSREFLEQLAAARRGKPHSEATRLKLSLANKGKRHPPEILAKIASALRGQKRTVEQRQRISASQKLRSTQGPRRKQSADAIQRRADAIRGHRRPGSNPGNIERNKIRGLKTRALHGRLVVDLLL